MARKSGQWQVAWWACLMLDVSEDADFGLLFEASALLYWMTGLCQQAGAQVRRF